MEVESFLDDRRGIMTTIRGKSWALRAPFQFKQSLKDASLESLLRAHDDALYLLHTRRVRTARIEHDDPLEFIQVEQRMLRGFFKRRWWLFAIRPLVIFLAPSRRRPLHEQADFARQIERYDAVLVADSEAIG